MKKFKLAEIVVFCLINLNCDNNFQLLAWKMIEKVTQMVDFTTDLDTQILFKLPSESSVNSVVSAECLVWSNETDGLILLKNNVCYWL